MAKNDDFMFHRTVSAPDIVPSRDDGARPGSTKGLAARFRARLGTFTSWLTSGVKKDYNITKTGVGLNRVLKDCAPVGI